LIYFNGVHPIFDSIFNSAIDWSYFFVSIFVQNILLLLQMVAAIVINEKENKCRRDPSTF